MSLNDLKSMPLHERMQLMEALWDTFVHEENVQSPVWHEKILESRTRIMERREVKSYSLDELKKER